MDSSEERAISEAIANVNHFLRMCNIKEIEYVMPERNFGTNVIAAIQNLAKKLSDIAEQQNTSQLRPEPDASVTQITATNKELNDRISAFMAHAQNVIDEQNVKEFCDFTAPRELPGCARTDACYKRRMSNSTHVQVSKATNVDGPQLKITAQGLWRTTLTTKPHPETRDTAVPQPIDERLINLEKHLKVTSADSSDVYTRLKNLENRLLAIEGTSPEYLSIKNQPDSAGFSKDPTLSDPKNFTLQEIDDRIRTLKQGLLSKKRKLDEGVVLL